MLCTPHYKNQERQEADSKCSPDCFHYAACLKELGLPPDWDFPPQNHWTPEQRLRYYKKHYTNQ